MAGPGIKSIGWFEDFDDFEVVPRFAYYWLTPFQYIKWRHQMYGKTMAEAKVEFTWLRDKHHLINCIEDGRCYFLIAVEDIPWMTWKHLRLMRSLRQRPWHAC